MPIRSVLLIVISFLLFTFFLGCTEEEVVEITDWTQLNKFEGTPRASATCFVVGTKAYVCLGRSGWKDGFLNDLWEYDSQSDQWTRKRDFPGSARVKAVAGVIGTKAYVGLGANGIYSKRFRDFWEYDTETDSWTQKDSFPDDACNDLFYAVVNGELYTTMGYDGTLRYFRTWKYNPASDEWTQLSDAPVSYNSKAGFVLGSSIYVGSGFMGYNLTNFFRYNTATDTWSQIHKLPEGRMLSSGLALAGKGYVMLGRFWNGALNNGRLLSDIVEYDPASDTWTKRGDFPGGARQNAVVFAIDSVGYVLMGEDDSQRKSDVWCFKP